MKIKFGKKRVNGWNNRHLHELKVMENLQKRIRNGFTLDSEESQFYDDTVSLVKRYMPESELARRLNFLPR